MKRPLMIMLAAAAIAICSGAAAEEKYKPFAGVMESLEYRPDPIQKWYMNDPAMEKGGPRIEGVYDFTYAPVDRGYRISYPLDICDMRIDLDAHGRLLGYEQAFRSADVEKALGYDRLTVRAEGGRIKAATYSGEKRKSEKSGGFGPDALDMQSLSQSLQALLQSGRAMSFKAEVHVRKGESYKMKCEYRASTDPLSLSPNYDFPPRMARALQAGRSYGVYVCSLEPPASFVYPYALYFAYDEGRGRSFCAFWGGKPAEAQYQARLFDEEGR
jgi:hypothetical protein